MPEPITVSWAEMKDCTNTTMKNESLALNGCEAGEETTGSSLLELRQVLVAIFRNMLKFTVFPHVVKTIFVRKCNPMGT